MHSLLQRLLLRLCANLSSSKILSRVLTIFTICEYKWCLLLTVSREVLSSLQREASSVFVVSFWMIC